jgi:MFS family permease
MSFPHLHVAIISLGVLAHAVSFTAPFPYVAFMMVDFKMAANLDEAGFAAGWITGMFMIGRALSGIPWGIAADRFGRKICLFASTFNVMVFGILFGFSTNFYMAIAARFCLGIGNGLFGISKTYLSEIVTSKEHEMLAISYLNGIYTLGLIIGPSIGGLLARPAVQYPTVFASTRLFGKYPYLLPSLFGAIIALLSNVAIALFLPETLKRDQRKETVAKGEYTVVNQLVPVEENDDIEMKKLSSSSDENPKLDSIITSPMNAKREEEEEEVEREEEDEEDDDGFSDDKIEEGLASNDLKSNTLVLSTSTTPVSPPKALPSTFKEMLLDPSVQNMFIVYMSFSFISVLSDEIFPLYAVTSISNGGLAWQMVQVGEALAAIGVGLIIFQFFVFRPCMKKYFTNGQKDILTKSLLFVAITMPLLPLLSDWTLRIVLENNPKTDTKTNPFLFAVVVFSILLYKFSNTTTSTSITVVVNSLVASSQRGTLNGIMMTAGNCFLCFSFIIVIHALLLLLRFCLGSLGYGVSPIIGSTIYAGAIRVAYGKENWKEHSSYFLPIDGRMIFVVGGLLSLMLSYYVYKYVHISTST